MPTFIKLNYSLISDANQGPLNDINVSATGSAGRVLAELAGQVRPRSLIVKLV